MRLPQALTTTQVATSIPTSAFDIGVAMLPGRAIARAELKFDPFSYERQHRDLEFHPWR